MPANYVLLERIELNASAASVTFSNIPQSGYTDLKIVVSARQDLSGFDSLGLRFNTLTTGNSSRWIVGNGVSASSSTDSGAFMVAGYVSLPGTSATASTFGSHDIYIPNYLSSNQKSVSSDAVSENNATTAYASLNAVLQTLTSPITTITLAPYSSGNFVQYSTFSLYGLAAVGTTPVIAPKATGGNITTDGTYWIHTFLATDVFTPQTTLTCDYLVVAGGGAGGGAQGPGGYGGSGGGGAGGLRSTVTATGGGGSLESPISVTAGTAYTIQVGAGGTGAAATRGTSGVNSIFSTITSTGGGGGGSQNSGAVSNDGLTGGSGGGGSYKAGTSNGGTGTNNQGYAGGKGGDDPGANGAGGGGAGAAGTNPGTGTSATAGGAGVATSISGSSVTYAGGGGGGSYNNNNFGAGGAGGGGAGGGNSGGARNNGVAGTTNTGGAGGGGSGTAAASSSSAGGNGGSGIVIIRYPIA